MNKTILNKISDYCENGSNAILREIENYCRENNLFFAEDEEFIQIEDEMFKLFF